MQLWGRIGPKLLGLFRYHRRRIIGDNGASWRCPLLVEARNIWSGQRPLSFLETWHRERFVPFRGFAAPVQAKPKPEVKGTEGPRINTAITAAFVRLVTDEGHTVVSRREAFERAKKLKLDLVEVQRTANPPVCKLMDFHREKYKQQMKEKERTKGKSELLRKGDCKEVRFTIKTEQKDLQMKADMTRRLMERGYRVKCMAMGKEEEDLGSLLSRLAALIEDVSFVESGPRVEKRQAYMIVRHTKFGPSKSKSGQKTAKVAKATTLPQASASPSSRSDAISTGPDVEVESESETETEYEDVNNDGTKEFASADVEEIDSEFGDRVPWSDVAAQNSSQASFTSENFDVNTEFGSKEVTSSIHEDHFPDAGLFSNDATNGSKIAAIDEILAGVDSSISSESGRGNDPVRSSSNMNRAGMNSKFITSEGPWKAHGTPISDPTGVSRKPAFGESRDAKGSIGHTLDGMPLHPETGSAENKLLDSQNHLRGGTPQIKPPKELFGRVRLSGTQHDSPTVRTPIHVDQNMTKTIGGLQSGKKTLREESVSSGPTISNCGESSGVSADSVPRVSYGVFSASKNMASGDGSSQGKKNRDTSSSVTSGTPDSNDVNRNKSSPETDNTNVHDNGKVRQGGWGIFSRDSSDSNRQRRSTDR